MSVDLFDAVKRNDAALVKKIIAGKGVDLDAFDNNGRSALSLAAMNGFFECAELLLEANADVKAPLGVHTPLRWAALHSRAECVKLLIEHKATVDAHGIHGYTALHYAAMGERPDSIEALGRAAGVDVDVRNFPGDTPLALAIRSNNQDCAEKLLDLGAKMSNVLGRVRIPDWMERIVTKRANAKRGLLVLLGVLRKRVGVSSSGTEHIGGRLPRDVVALLGMYVWATRFNEQWIVGVADDNVVPLNASKASICHLQ